MARRRWLVAEGAGLGPEFRSPQVYLLERARSVISVSLSRRLRRFPISEVSVPCEVPIVSSLKGNIDNVLTALVVCAVAHTLPQLDLPSSSFT